MRPLRVALVVALMVLATACGGDEPGASSTPTPTLTTSPTPTFTTSPTSTGNPVTGNTIDIIDNSYDPPELTITVGTEVVWTQTGTSTHTVTASDGSFDSHPQCPADLSACMKPGESFRRTFTTVGRFPYACKIHGPLMSDAIVVR